MIRIPVASGARVISKTGASLVFESSGISPRMAASGLAERSSGPDSGKIYKCSITMKDGGKKLRVRGFISLSMLGRTEYWLCDE